MIKSSTPGFFHGPRLKIKRADQHISELQGWLNRIQQENAGTVRPHKEANSGAASHTILVQRPRSYSECVAPIVGDVAHNLRSALDLAASDIVRAWGEDPERPPVHFPFGETRQAIVNSQHWGRIQRLAPDMAIAVVDTIKPYKTANYALWALNRLDRMDKHRVLIPTVPRALSIVMGIREEQEDDPPPGVVPGVVYMLVGERKADGTVVSVSREPRAGSAAWLHNQQNGYPTLDVRFGKGEVFEDEPIIPTLKQLRDIVAKAIDALETLIE